MEIARRAEQCLKDVGEPPTLPALAAARLLARRAPDGAVAVLLAYLPFAGDDAVEDEVLAALLALTPAGKADPALAAALDDPLPGKRAAAAHVLARKGDKDQQAAVRKRLDDADARVRWRAALSLLTVHDKAGVPGLIGLLADGPAETTWRAEEVLRRLAGEKAEPAVATLGDFRASRAASAATPGRRGGRTTATAWTWPTLTRANGCSASPSGSNTTPTASGNATPTARRVGRSADLSRPDGGARCCPAGGC